MHKNTQIDITLLLISETYECIQNIYIFFWPCSQIMYILKKKKNQIHYLGGNGENQLFFVQSLTEQIQISSMPAHT